MIKKLFYIAIILMGLNTSFFAQELDCKVIVNYEQLDNASKERVANFAPIIENYMNTTKFTGSTWNWDKIKCSLNIFFTGSSDDIKYAAQAVINSQRKIEGTDKYTLMLNILDNAWKFEFDKNQSMYFNPTDFNGLTSFLDFYAYIIIGFDSDTYDILGGSDYFQRAYDICNLGSTAPKYSDGWQTESTSYNRNGLVENLFNARYQQFRQDYYLYHYNGLDIFSKQPDKAVKNMSLLISNLFEIKDKIDRRSPLLKVFFDAKYNEIIEYMKKNPDKSIFKKLQAVDPGHVSKYLEAEKE